MTYSGPTAILFKPSNQLEIERYRHFPPHFHRDSRFHLTTRCHFHQRSRRCHQVLLGTYPRRSAGCLRKRSSDYSGGRHQVLVYFQKSGSLSFTRQIDARHQLTLEGMNSSRKNNYSRFSLSSSLIFKILRSSFILTPLSRSNVSSSSSKMVLSCAFAL